MGSSGENSAFGPTRNPWAVGRAPGGSSSGSAAAVAAGVVPLALGTDTGGSVRQPAALCGVSGFKPTYGRVSRYGLVAFGSSFDQVSPLARSALDLELTLSVVSGRDPADSTALDADAVVREPGDDLRGVRVGVPAEYLGDGLEDGVRARVEEAIEDLLRLGAERVDVSLPHTEHAIATYYVIANAEASSNLARYDGVRYGARVDGDGTLHGMFAATRSAGFGDEVERRILVGTYVLSAGYQEAWYGRAQRVRTLVAGDFARAFEACDLIVGPTSPTTAFALGERTGDPVAMYLSDVLTVPVSLAALPAASVPCGLADAGGDRLPVGLQIVGPALADARVLRAARVFQSATRHHQAVPPVFAAEARP
jgi:aspartyl-tRNA(Asn)/glutamyl-tRNA(Gln) amidotransferase subunit A